MHEMCALEVFVFFPTVAWLSNFKRLVSHSAGGKGDYEVGRTDCLP